MAFAKDALNFLGESFNTDELKRQLEVLRDNLNQKSVEHAALAAELNEVDSDLRSMEIKSEYLLNIIGQNLDVFEPPVPDGWEATYDKRKKQVYDPLQNGVAIVGVVGATTWLAGAVLIPAVFKLAGVLFKSKKLVMAAKSARLLKLAKVGKGTVYLAIAVTILETAIKMVEAKKINDFMRKKRSEFEGHLDEANMVLAQYKAAIAQGNALKGRILKEAGVPDVAAYMASLNNAIAEVAEQSTFARIARNMLRMGQSVDDIVAIMPTLEKQAVHSISNRLNAEIMLLNGATPEDVAAEIGMTLFQVQIVERVLEVRADAARGLDDDELVEIHAVTDAVADLQIDLAEAALTKVWDKIEAGAPLTPIAEKTLIPEIALARLQNEIQARAALWTGSELSVVEKQFPDIGSDRLAQIAAEVPDQIEDTRNSPLAPEKLAVQLRLPKSVVEATI